MIIIKYLLFLSLIMVYQSYSWKLTKTFRLHAPLKAVKSSSTASTSKIPTSVSRTDSGAALELKNVNLCIGSNKLISGIDWLVMPKERWALVGKNGAGIFTYILVYCR